jgi:hypothetical protein
MTWDLDLVMHPTSHCLVEGAPVLSARESDYQSYRWMKGKKCRPTRDWIDI